MPIVRNSPKSLAGKKYRHTPSKNPRVEVRPPPGELARWREEARRLGLPLATWIQRVCRDSTLEKSAFLTLTPW
jgi:hypothetical protein